MARTERQAHGFIFEDWIKARFLDLAYTSKWDISPKINPNGEIGVHIKTEKWRTPIEMGEAFARFEIDEDFELLVAFWEKDGKRKKIVYMGLIKITKEQWRKMWGNLSKEDLVSFYSLVREKSKRSLKGVELDTFRGNIQTEKEKMLKGYNGCISIHPKIDSKNQRRVQCSISFKKFFKEFKLKEQKMVKYTLWGKEICLSAVRLE